MANTHEGIIGGQDFTVFKPRVNWTSEEWANLREHGLRSGGIVLLKGAYLYSGKAYPNLSCKYGCSKPELAVGAVIKEPHTTSGISNVYDTPSLSSGPGLYSYALTQAELDRIILASTFDTALIVNVPETSYVASFFENGRTPVVKSSSFQVLSRLDLDESTRRNWRLFTQHIDRFPIEEIRQSAKGWEDLFGILKRAK